MTVLKKLLCVFTVIFILGYLHYALNYKYANDLYLAIYQNDNQRAEKLLNFKAGNINSLRSPIGGLFRAMAYENVYPLQIAAKKNPQLAFKIIERGGKVELKDPYIKSSPLIYALNSTSGDRYKLSKYMIDLGADINHIDDVNRTALNSVVIYLDEDSDETKKEGIELLEYLLDNINNLEELEQKSGTNPLIIASGYNNTEALLYLLKGEFYDVNGAPEGMTALMKASQRGSIESCKLLLQYGASKDIETPKGKTAIDFAKDNGHKDIVELLQN